jgi:hypothetical protein
MGPEFFYVTTPLFKGVVQFESLTLLLVGDGLGTKIIKNKAAKLIRRS